ncbi:HAMP domain-containing sensor histidine kinase [Lysinibacillus sp. KU-BSD001]|uniref:sensor histidine kinase n=1 Tax=Lysinibacillus sp. KU-BSD001 TaxID=3141328 RepID=UPI0036E53155
MFKKTRKKLTVFYSTCFLGFFFVFLVILYFSLVQLMDHQQMEELETYYTEQYHDFFEHMYDQDRKLEFNPNRLYFYYIYTKEQRLVHGDETYKGLYKEIESIYSVEDTSESFVKRLHWHDEHFLLLSKPIHFEEELLGYIVLGKSTTSQYHFFQKMLLLFVVLVIIFTLFIGFLSYYMAGKAMVPIENALEKQKNFVSDASHELRTPLSVFYSSLDILAADESKNVSDFGKELIQDLKDEAELMKELLEKLLFLARHYQNRLEVKKERFSLTDLLGSISEKFQRTLREEIVFQTDIEKDVQLIGDPKKIIELIYILLENAVQYTPHGSISLKLSQTDEKIKIVVEDTGIGIAKDELPLIFDRFFRSDAARKRDGTGLGLSIAEAIVKEHGGMIQVQSELGKGTTFCTLFPSIKH